MPFDFLKRKKDPEAAPAPAATPVAVTQEEGIPFDGFTEDWRLVGRMLVDGRLSDALNRREPIPIAGVSWAPTDGSEPLGPAPGLKTVDPYDLVLVMAGDDSLPDMTEEERTAHRVHKVAYEVALEVPPYRVIGTVFLFPGSEPESLLNRASEMFVPIIEATASLGDHLIGNGAAAAILVNRAYLRGVDQVDALTGERHEKLPGAGLGGINWTDRTR